MLVARKPSQLTRQPKVVHSLPDGSTRDVEGIEEDTYQSQTGLCRGVAHVLVSSSRTVVRS